MPDAPLRPSVAVFDVNETLIDLRAWSPALREAGLPEGSLPLLFARVLRDGFAIAAAGGFQPFSALLSSHLRQMLPIDHEPARDDAVERLTRALESLPLHEDVAPGLRRLRDEDVRVVTLTNGDATLTRTVLGAHGVLELVERTFDVAAAQAWKPRPEPYHHVAHELDVGIERLALFSVHPWDIHGARRAGMSTAWLNRDQGRYPDTMEPPDANEPSLPKLVESLLGMSR